MHTVNVMFSEALSGSDMKIAANSIDFDVPKHLTALFVEIFDSFAHTFSFTLNYII
jgi:hypothetical protein